MLVILILAGIGLRFFEYRFSSARVSLKDEPLNVLVAKTPKQWYRGLGQRETLGNYAGMLFLFPFADQHIIVMRDMHFSIDIVWLLNGKVVDIAPEVPIEPQDRPYIPRQENNTVLELPAGWTKAHDLKIGDTLKVVKE